MTIDDLEFTETQSDGGVNRLFTAYTPLGRITVFVRMERHGCGIRYVETGFTDPEGTFWLASGRFDIRRHGSLSIEDAVALIKREAIPCAGIPSYAAHTSEPKDDTNDA